MPEPFEKRDIVEVAEELGIDLDYHDAARPYYSALCPLHDDTSPSFNIFPKVQRWCCWSCHPELSDVIDLVREVEGVGFLEAKKIATIAISPERHMLNVLQGITLGEVDEDFLQKRAATLNDRPRVLNFQNTQRILQQFDEAMQEGRWQDADRVLRAGGV